MAGRSRAMVAGVPTDEGTIRVVGNPIKFAGARDLARYVATSDEAPLGRAETTLFGKVKGNVHVESQGMANGTTSQRVMVGIKLPF